MNRSELVLRFAQKRNISKAAAQRFINAIFEEMIQALGCGEHIEFRGFGTLHCRSYDSYTGRNPKTGEYLEVESRRRVRYKMSEHILRKLNIDIENFDDEVDSHEIDSQELDSTQENPKD
tara:strand:+ start:410 stop:769 length:360 start_codon:yes stop_codon:yes gene_type:complete